MNWDKLHRHNKVTLAKMLREKYGDTSVSPVTETAESLCDRVVLVANTTREPIEEVPAHVLVRLGIVPTIGDRAPEPLNDGAEEDVLKERDEDTGETLAPLVNLTRRAVITLHPSQNEPNFAKVSVNGRAIQIMCEKRAAIPWEHYMVLEDAIQGVPRTTDGSVPAGLVEFDPMRRFNYTFHGEVWTDSTGKVIRRVAQQVEDVA